MPVLMSHILMVLSLDPDSRKGPGLPLFLVCRRLCFKLWHIQGGKKRQKADPLSAISQKNQIIRQLTTNKHTTLKLGFAGILLLILGEKQKMKGINLLKELYVLLIYRKYFESKLAYCKTSNAVVGAVQVESHISRQTSMKFRHTCVSSFFIKSSDASLRIFGKSLL